jgi:hypothetical protein
VLLAVRNWRPLDRALRLLQVCLTASRGRHPRPLLLVAYPAARLQAYRRRRFERRYTGEDIALRGVHRSRVLELGRKSGATLCVTN